MKHTHFFMTLTKKLSFYMTAIMLCIALSSCSKQVSKKEMHADELSKKTYAYLEKKKYEEAIGCLEEIMARFPDHAHIVKYKMLLAELYFKTEQYALAHTMYEHFNQFYPADDRAEYSKYKALLSMFNQTLRTDCDQTETEESVRLCHEYLQNNNYKKYHKDVIEIQKTCENKLVDKEIYVFNFYMKHENYNAAHTRLKHIKEKYLANNQDLEARILYLECRLAQKEKSSAVFKQNLAKLTEKYPDSKFTHMAQAAATPRPFIF